MILKPEAVKNIEEALNLCRNARGHDSRMDAQYEYLQATSKESMREVLDYIEVLEAKVEAGKG